MDKDTKIELLKIFGMIVILVVLICGIVYLNKAHDISVNETNTTIEEKSVEETNTEESEKSEKKSEKSTKSSKKKDNSDKDNKKD